MRKPLKKTAPIKKSEKARKSDDPVLAKRANVTKTLRGVRK
jgi:hypothetical protein